MILKDNREEGKGVIEFDRIPKRKKKKEKKKKKKKKKKERKKKKKKKKKKEIQGKQRKKERKNLNSIKWGDRQKFEESLPQCQRRSRPLLVWKEE